ncbi:thioredoxin family protein [Candidatus Poribacteria bacterium]|nr:thioredoxin family protein [Candidatus Poribacteria bacterium]
MVERSSARGRVFFAVMALLAMLGTPGARAEESLDWIRTWAEAKTIAKREPKPVMVYFYNFKARPCHMMQTQTFENPEVKKRLKVFHCVALLEEQNRELFRQQKFFKVPSTVFLDANGNELDRAIGFKTSEDFVQYIDRIIESQKKSSGFAQDTGGGAPKVQPLKGTAVDILSEQAGPFAFTLTYPAPEAKSVVLAGDFNDWRTDAHPMTKLPNGSWTLTVHLPEGFYEYMFVTDDGVYHPDETNPLKKPNPYSGTNSVLLAGNPKTSPMIQGRSATFILYNAEATTIELAGSFTDWKRVPMFRNKTEPGMWGVRYDLPPGFYTYKYVIDDIWISDPENYNVAADGQGNLNSSFVIN